MYLQTLQARGEIPGLTTLTNSLDVLLLLTRLIIASRTIAVIFRIFFGMIFRVNTVIRVFI